MIKMSVRAHIRNKEPRRDSTRLGADFFPWSQPLVHGVDELLGGSLGGCVAPLGVLAPDLVDVVVELLPDVEINPSNKILSQVLCRDKSPLYSGYIIAFH